MKKKILLLLLVFVTIFTITGCGCSKKGKENKKQQGREIENYVNVFFIREGNKYALFNDEGKKLTDFVFTSSGTFVNGAALVKNEVGPGIIGTNGKMIVDFGKYKYIYQEAGLFKATDGDNNQYLLNYKGEKITDLKNKTLTTFIGEDKYSLLFDSEKGEYQVLDTKGNSLLTFDKGTIDKPTSNNKMNFVSVFNGTKNYVVDLVSGKKVVDFDSDVHYCVNNASDDGKIITLNSCVGTFEKQDKTTYKFIKDGKVYDVNDKCDSIMYSSNNIICSKDNKKYLLDKDANVGISIDGVTYTDNEHYAKAKNGSFNGIDFYENGNVVKNVECRTIHDYGYSKSGYYVLSTYFSTTCNTQSGTSEFYNTKGEKAFDKSFKSVQQFDDNLLARVSEDKTNYYLIDTKGNKVTDDYDSIYDKYNYYVVTKNKLLGILDNKGKVIIEPKYSRADIFKEQGVLFVRLQTEDSKYIIYNIDTKKEVATFDSAPVTNTNYMTITKDGKVEYYTYTGKLFYTASN